MPLRDLFRILLAAALSGLIVWLAPIRWGMAQSFATTLPMMVLCGGWLARRSERLGPTVLALTLCVPAVATRMWGHAILEMEAHYVQSYLTDERLLLMCIDLLQPLAPLLLSAAAGLVVLGGRGSLSGAGILAAGGLSIVLSAIGLEHVLSSLQNGSYAQATRLAQVAPALALLPLAFLPACRGPGGLIRLAVVLCVASLSISPLGRVLPAPPSVAPDSPIGVPGLVVDLVPIAPGVGDFAAALEATGLSPHAQESWCQAESKWDSNIRITVSLAMSDDDDLTVLTDALPALIAHGVNHLAIQGRAEPLPGRLGARLSGPAAQLILEPPPPGAGHAIATADGIRWIRPAQDGQCFIEPRPEMTIGDLFRHIQMLQSPGGPCTKQLGLSLHSSPPRDDGWRPPRRCSAVEFNQQE
ncbi:MAG: hypothetical protein P8R54_01805 [Myxococcota bacterium]|nr:hypothetical protein [Myxococcota bacterium]